MKKQENTNKFAVNIETKHDFVFVNKKLFIAFKILKIIISLGVSIFLTIILYKNCLFNNNCNPIVVTYLSLLSLACLANVGLPIEKLSNIGISTK